MMNAISTSNAKSFDSIKTICHMVAPHHFADTISFVLLSASERSETKQSKARENDR